MFNNNKRVNDEKVDKKFWIISTVTFFVSLAVCLAIYFTLPPVFFPFNPVATQHQLNFLKFCGVAECLICAIGFSWLVGVGTLLSRMPPKIKPKIIGIYCCCSFFLISWFPHITLHGYYATDVWATLGLDFSFHWTIMASSVFLGTFFYTFLRKLSGYKNHRKILSREFYATDAFFAFSVTVVLGIVFCAGLQRTMESEIPVSDAQRKLAIFVGITEAFVSAFGFAWLIGMISLITKIQDAAVRWKAIPSVVSIWWLLSSWWFHTRLHAKVPTLKGIDPISWILIEIFFHWITMFAGLVICFNMYGLIRLAEVAGKYNSKTSVTRKAHSARSLSKTKTDSQDQEVQMEVVTENSGSNSKSIDHEMAS